MIDDGLRRTVLPGCTYQEGQTCTYQVSIRWVETCAYLSGSECGTGWGVGRLRIVSGDGNRWHSVWNGGVDGS